VGGRHLLRLPRKNLRFLLGEIMRRATGRTISTLLRDEITGPLGIEDDVHFGVPQRLLPCVARQVASENPAPDFSEPGSPLDRAMPCGIVPDATARTALAAFRPAPALHSRWWG
jgi:CubicO group peptidase (beta-lactamase class C family)